MKHLLISLLILTVIGFTYIGCDDEILSPSSGQGKLVIYLTDAPGSYAEVNIQIHHVEVHSLEHGWQVVNTFNVDEGEGTYNLLALTNGVMEIIGEENLEAGLYTQVRLILTDNNYLVLTDGAEHQLMVPSGEQTGLKIPHNFEIVQGETYELLLDFDAHHSIVQAGQSGIWLLKPVIRVQSMEDSGSLTGKVEADGEPVEGALVRVLEEVNGDEEFVASSLTNENGEFMIVHLAPGEYIVEVEADGYETKRLEEKVMVEVGITKDLGVIVLQPSE